MDESCSKRRKVDPSLPGSHPFIDTFYIDQVNSESFSFLQCCLASATVVYLDLSAVPNHEAPEYKHVEIAMPAIPWPLTHTRTRVFFLDYQCLSHRDAIELVRMVAEDPHVVKICNNFKMEFTQFCDYMYYREVYCFSKLKSVLDTVTIYHSCRTKADPQLASMCQELHADFDSEATHSIKWSTRPCSVNAVQGHSAHCALLMFFIFYQVLIKGNICALPKSTEFAIPNPTESLNAASDNSNDRPSYMMLYWCSTTPPAIFEDNVFKNIKKYTESIFLFASSKRSKRLPWEPLPSLRSKYMEILNNRKLPFWDSATSGNGSPTFLCDSSFKGLAVHLRYVGLDAKRIPSMKLGIREIMAIAFQEKRIILTQDIKLLKYKCLSLVPMCQIIEDKVEDQFVQIIQKLDVKVNQSDILSRCVYCNSKVEVDTEYTSALRWKCPVCDRTLLYKNEFYDRIFNRFSKLCKLNG